VNLLVLRIHGVLAQGLQMLPAAQHSDVADCRLHHGQVGAVTFSKHGAFNMGGFELAAGFDHTAFVVDQPLSHVEAAPGLLAEANRQPDLQITTRLDQPIEFRRPDDQ